MGQAQHCLELVQCNVMFRPDLTNFVPVLLGITKTFYFQQVFLAGEDETHCRGSGLEEEKRGFRKRTLFVASLLDRSPY